MIIRAIRLKNIKSYGKGPDGNGITVTFEPGVNRIAGKNGHGKTTLIEGLGFALFFSEPVFAERFKAETYLLRAGEKSGEIDVTFEHAGELYRLERGLGPQSRRRSKVVLVRDGGIEAEDDREVEEYLCRLFGFHDSQRLSELFTKLIGVKQGRLGWPFDSKAKDACVHFEPLLDVEIFRECFHRLAPVEKEFETLREAQARALAGIQERIRDRADSVEKVSLRRKEFDDLSTSLAAAGQALKLAQEHCASLEEKERSVIAARTSAEAAVHARDLASEKLVQAEQRLKEARDAAVTVQETSGGHAQFVQAEEALVQLLEKQKVKESLLGGQAAAKNRAVEFSAKAAGAMAQAQTFLEQRDTKGAGLAQLNTLIVQLQEQLAAEQPDLERLALQVEGMRKDRDLVRGWLDNLPATIAATVTRAATIEASGKVLLEWNPAQFETAKAAEVSARLGMEEVATKLSVARESHAVMREQLNQIAGGVCPFLKTQCAQFDSQRVTGDVTARQQMIATLDRDLGVARENHGKFQREYASLASQEARLGQVRNELELRVAEFIAAHNGLEPGHIRSAGARLADSVDGQSPARMPVTLPAIQRSNFVTSGTAWKSGSASAVAAEYDPYFQQFSAWFDGIASVLDQRLKEFELKQKNLLHAQRDLENLRKQEKALSAEIGTLTKNAAAKQQESGEFRKRAEAEEKSASEFSGKLEAFTTLDADIRTQQERKNGNATAHERFLVAKPLAGQLGDRERDYNALTREKELTEAALGRARENIAQVTKDFDPEALKTARKVFEEATARLAHLNANLQNAKIELQREEKRQREYEAALKEKKVIETELGRLSAAILLTNKSRFLLKSAAPAVAAHICRHIARRAQVIFNQINHDPVELEWDSNAYSLRIHPGERRFAMLSGGEQTKLALSMTLAMIQEFSNLRFCIFDEPTYGVDAESRRLLAGAIIEVQRATNFDQLLIVSHDDAFDGKIEHVVLLRKTPSGTEVVQAG